MGQIKAVVFDCDGVMFDSKSANEAFYNAILAHFQKPPLTPAQLDLFHMQTGDEAMTALFPDAVEFRAAQIYRNEMGYRQFIPLMDIEPHLKPLLESIASRVYIAIVTNRTDTIYPVLEVFELQDYFDLVVTSLDVANPKPHPEPLVRILTHFDIQPDQALYVGDSPVDEAAAAAAGIPLVAFSNRKLSAAFHITGLNEIEPLLNGAS
jgi:phosphoglycolate phosphatase